VTAPGMGYPGGFTTMMGISFIEDIIENNHNIDAAEILIFYVTKLLQPCAKLLLAKKIKMVWMLPCAK